MAYKAKLFENDGKFYGLFPNKAGEFCGNRYKNDPRISRDALKHFEQESSGNHCENFREGKPSFTATKTSSQMSDDGFVGLYLISDSPFSIENGIEVETDELCEGVVSGQRKPLKSLALNALLKES